MILIANSDIHELVYKNWTFFAGKFLKLDLPCTCTLLFFLNQSYLVTDLRSTKLIKHISALWY